jgi:hypothetical protein
VTTTDDGITSGTMTAIEKSSSSAEASVTVEHHALLKSPEKPGSFFGVPRRKYSQVRSEIEVNARKDLSPIEMKDD